LVIAVSIFALYKFAVVATASAKALGSGYLFDPLARPGKPLVDIDRKDSGRCLHQLTIPLSPCSWFTE